MVDFYAALHDRYSALAQECQYIPAMKSSFSKLCTDIGMFLLLSWLLDR